MKKKDLAVYLAIFILFICSVFMFYTTGTVSDIVRVYVDKKMFGEYSIHEDGKFIIKGADDVSLELIIEDKNVFVRNATCPDKICETTKGISKSNESIICLPGKIVITLDTDESLEYDTISR